MKNVKELQEAFKAMKDHTITTTVAEDAITIVDEREEQKKNAVLEVKISSDSKDSKKQMLVATPIYVGLGESGKIAKLGKPAEWDALKPETLAKKAQDVLDFMYEHLEAELPAEV